LALLEIESTTLRKKKVLFSPGKDSKLPRKISSHDSSMPLSPPPAEHKNRSNSDLPPYVSDLLVEPKPPNPEPQPQPQPQPVKLPDPLKSVREDDWVHVPPERRPSNAADMDICETENFPLFLTIPSNLVEFVREIELQIEKGYGTIQHIYFSQSFSTLEIIFRKAESANQLATAAKFTFYQADIPVSKKFQAPVLGYCRDIAHMTTNVDVNKITEEFNKCGIFFQSLEISSEGFRLFVESVKDSEKMLQTKSVKLFQHSEVYFYLSRLFTDNFPTLLYCQYEAMALDFHRKFLPKDSDIVFCHPFSAKTRKGVFYFSRVSEREFNSVSFRSVFSSTNRRNLHRNSVKQEKSVWRIFTEKFRLALRSFQW
jgi:hypothetical protein